MTPSQPDNRYGVVILQGRAMVRLIEAIDVLVTVADEYEVAELRAHQTRYRRHLRQLIADLPPAVSAQILIASDKIHGQAGDTTPN